MTRARTLGGVAVVVAVDEATVVGEVAAWDGVELAWATGNAVGDAVGGGAGGGLSAPAAADAGCAAAPPTSPPAAASNNTTKAHTTHKAVEAGRLDGCGRCPLPFTCAFSKPIGAPRPSARCRCSRQ